MYKTYPREQPDRFRARLRQTTLYGWEVDRGVCAGGGGSITLGEIGVFCVGQGLKGDWDLGNV